MEHIYDMIIIGGGPAGYTAALYAARAGLDTVVLERMSAGGQMALTGDIDNYPGFEEGVDGFTLGMKMQQGAERFGAKTEYEDVTHVDLSEKIKKVHTYSKVFEAKTVVIATGANPRELGVANEQALIGRGVPKGKNMIGGFAWNGFYVLDIEQPEVRDYIKNVFRVVFDEWGYDMVKLDFLYSVAIQPRNNKSRGQLMHEAMDFLRECCGDKIILGCGVPLSASFGIVDACRISCDVELSFKEKFYVKVTNQEIISAKMAMNNSIFRRHLNGRIFANDPDVFFLRDDGMKPAKFNWEQKKLLARINHMFGSVLFVSDNAGAYDDKKVEVLLDSFKKFDGKVISAEYIKEKGSGDEVIAIEYEENGVKKCLAYNTLTGKHTDSVVD